MKKKRFVSVLLSVILSLSMVVCLSFSSGVQTMAASKKADSKSVLLNKVKKKTNQKITKVLYADYDGNGKKELFAVCGKMSDFNVRNQIWFASTKQVKHINTSNMSVYSAKRAKVSKKQNLFVAEYGGGGSGSSSVWYYVKSGKLKGNNVKFSGLTQIKGKNFKITEHAFDNCEYDGISTGHTYRRYYIKWTGKKFKEYVGKKISQKTLKKYSKGSSYLKQAKSLGYTIDKIYKRGNGIININIHKSDSYSRYNENINLKIKKKSVSLIVINKNGSNIVEKSSYGGIYKAKLL